jgi:hypothetical protein
MHAKRVSLQVDLGPISTDVEPEAEELLSRLPAGATTALLASIRKWLSSQRAVTRAHVVTVVEPEAPDWKETVIELHVDADTERALEMWDDLANSLDRIKEGLNDEDRQAMDERFGVQFIWGEEGGDDDAED